MSNFPVDIIIAFSGGFLLACLPRCPHRGKIIWGVCRDSPVMHRPCIYLWRSERNVEYLWSYFLSLNSSTWTEIKLFPHKQNWFANDSLLCLCTPAVMWLYLKCDPGRHTDSWGCPERTLPSLATADAAGAALGATKPCAQRRRCSLLSLPLPLSDGGLTRPAASRAQNLSAFTFWSPWVPPTPAGACTGVWGWSRKGVECSLAIHGSCLIPMASAISKNLGLRSAKQRGFINCAFIRTAVSSMLSFSENVLPHLHFVYKERCFLRNISSAAFFRWSFMPNSFCYMSVHLNVPFPPLVEFWSLNLAEDDVWKLDSWSEFFWCFTKKLSQT